MGCLTVRATHSQLDECAFDQEFHNWLDSEESFVELWSDHYRTQELESWVEDQLDEIPEDSEEEETTPEEVV